MESTTGGDQGSSLTASVYFTCPWPLLAGGCIGSRCGPIITIDQYAMGDVMCHSVVSPSPNELYGNPNQCSRLPCQSPPCFRGPGLALIHRSAEGGLLAHSYTPIAPPRRVIRPPWCSSPAFSKKANQPSQVAGLRRGTSEVLEQSAASSRRSSSSNLTKVRGKVTLSMRQDHPRGPVGHRLRSGEGVDP